MESTAADAMPDDTDLTPQAPEPEQAPAESSGETSTDPAGAEANPVMELALTEQEWKERRNGNDPYWRAIGRDAVRLSAP